MRIEISRILHNSFVIAWGNSQSLNFSANTNYQLIYTKRTLYNRCILQIWQTEETTPEESKIISFSMIAYVRLPLSFVNLIVNFQLLKYFVIVCVYICNIRGFNYNLTY